MNEQWHTHTVNLADDELEHLGREWLLTNGTGAYAMGTLPAINTRRYHGLFVAAVQPPVGRMVALNQMFEQLVLTSPAGTQTIEWSSCHFQQDDGQLIQAPQGNLLLRRFDRGLTIRWVYVFKHIQFIRELILHQNEQAATVQYQVSGLMADESAVLRVQPMLTLRDFHSLYQRADDFGIDAGVDQIQIDRHGVDFPGVQIKCLGSTFAYDPDWWFGVSYPADAERGQDHKEDYFLPGYFETAINPGQSAMVEVQVQVRVKEDQSPRPVERATHLQPMCDALEKFAGDDAELLAIAADDFVVKRTVGDRTLSTILAGYPWFADWGRDTFIALPGLLLCTGRHDEARDTLAAFASVIRHGLVPNRFDDYDKNADAAHYNSVDASLWFVRAAHAYMDATGDQDAWRDWLEAAVRQIIEGYIRGAGHDVRMAGDGMIYAGNDRTQLTWMDAKCDDVVFTPRQGKAVEINALWYCALAQTAERLKDSDKQAANHFTKLTQRIKRAFVKTFWDDERRCLRDHVWQTDDGDQEHADRAIRPNQIFTVSLPFSPLPQTKQRHVLKTVKDQLLTDYGLRTLPESDPHYHPFYSGNGFDRDKAYHQGTVWPWLIGPYAEGVLRAGKFSEESKTEALGVMMPLLNEMRDRGLGQLHEIHEAAYPHRAVGCMAQAWSVAEVIRVLDLIHSK